MQPEYNHTDYIVLLKPALNIMLNKIRMLYLYIYYQACYKKISNVNSQNKVIHVKGKNSLSISQEVLEPIKFFQIKGFPLIHIINKSKT